MLPAASPKQPSHALDLSGYPCQASDMRVIVFILVFWLPASAHSAPPHSALPRIVSLSLCADPYLMAFAERNQVRALTWNSQDPAQSPFAERAASYPVTSGRLEEIVEMAPDLVILSPFSLANRRQTLHRLGIATVTLNGANNYASAREEIMALGRAIGRQAEAREYLAGLDAQMMRFERQSHETRLLNIQRRGFTTGAGHILDDIIDRAGGQNMGRMVGDAMVAVSLEHVLMLRPEYLILIGTPGAPGTPGTPPQAVDRGTEFLAHPVLRQHFPPRRRIILPASLVQCAGASTPLAVSALQAALADQRGVSSPR